MTPIPEHHHGDILAIYTAHGTTVAADWAGVSHDSVRKIADQHGTDRHQRHAGHLINRAIDPHCSCPRCAGKPRPGWLTLTAVNELLGEPEPTADAWRTRAACLGVDTSLFYLGAGDDSGPAKALCAGCPVRGECLEEALATSWGDDFGIWAGTTRRERKRLRAERNRDRYAEAQRQQGSAA